MNKMKNYSYYKKVLNIKTILFSLTKKFCYFSPQWIKIDNKLWKKFLFLVETEKGHKFTEFFKWKMI